MADGVFQDIAEYIRVSKDSVDLLKSAWTLLPKGESREEAEGKIQAAEKALQRTDAALALKLGFILCQCTYPPQIMLWREKQQGHFCPRAECGRHTGSFNRDIGTIKTDYF